MVSSLLRVVIEQPSNVRSVVHMREIDREISQPVPARPDPVLGVIEYALAAMLAFTLFVAPILGALIGSAEDDGAADAVETAGTSVAFVFVFTLGFQILQGAYPWIFSRRRGRTIESDWRFVSQLPKDIFVGMFMAVACFVLAQIATVTSGNIVGLEDTNEASNTDILLDNKGSPWIIGVILLVVVGAPLAEELLFRGLILRTLQKWGGKIFAIVASSALFAIPHWQPDATWQQTVVLLSALGVVGLVLAIGAVVTDRLGPSVIAHFLFNMTGTIVALFF